MFLIFRTSFLPKSPLRRAPKSTMNVENKLRGGVISCWDFQLLIIWGCLSLEFIFIWSPYHKLKNLGRSGQWFLRYSTFNIFRSPSIVGHLPFKKFVSLVGPLGVKLEFEEDLISGCWDIQLFIFWRHLSLEVVFMSRKFLIWFGPLSIDLKFVEDPISGCWDIQYLLLWGLLPLEVVFISRFF